MLLHRHLLGVLAQDVQPRLGVDLILEPVAFYTGIWTWLEPYTLQVYWGSTVANALVWLGMCYLGIKLWEVRVESARTGVDCTLHNTIS